MWKTREKPLWGFLPVEAELAYPQGFFAGPVYSHIMVLVPEISIICYNRKAGRLLVR